MLGKRLYELLNELPETEHRKLMLITVKSEDKRLKILHDLMKLKISSLEYFNDCLLKITTDFFKNKKRDEIEHICRRNIDYYVAVVENIIVEHHLINDVKIKNLILAESLEKSGNPFLLEYYYERALKNAHAFHDSMVEMKAIRGMIRINFNKQTEASYRHAVLLNNELKSDIEYYYHEKYVDYYNTVSNVYIESNLLIGTSEEKLIKEIELKINECDFVQFKIGYLISQARLSYKNNKFFIYLNKAYQLLDNTEFDVNEKNILKRKILFLELIIGFYFNRNQQDLLIITDTILQINKENNFIDNNTLFHKLLLLVLNNKIEEALSILSAEKKYFKGNSSVLKEFIFAFIFYKRNQLKKCLNSLNQLNYNANYFIALFSKLLSIKIHLDLKSYDLTKSLIYNTERFIKRNKDKYIVYDISIFTVNYFKLLSKQNFKALNKEFPINISPYHIFLLQQ